MDESKSIKNSCVCEADDHVVLNRRQASFVTAGLILVVGAAFITGYIIGQRKALQEFSDRLADESFTDKVRYALYSSYGTTATTGDEQEDLEEEVEKDDVVKDSEEKKTISKDNQEQAPQKLATEQAPIKQYYAQLIGFGTQKAAEQFVETAQRYGLPMRIEKRVSKTAKGKAVAWYQVVTERFADKEELNRIVEKVKIAERLQQVKILEE